MIRPLYYKTRRGESPSRAFQGCRSYFFSLWEKGGGRGGPLPHGARVQHVHHVEELLLRLFLHLLGQEERGVHRTLGVKPPAAHVVLELKVHGPVLARQRVRVEGVAVDVLLFFEDVGSTRVRNEGRFLFLEGVGGRKLAILRSPLGPSSAPSAAWPP